MKGKLNHRIAVYTGTFDPIHLGHLDIIARGSLIFDKLVIGVGINPDKAPFFSLEERVDLIRKSIEPYPNVSVEGFENLAVNYVRAIGAGTMLRGLRTTSDMENEFTMSLMNHNLDPEIQTVFLMAKEPYSHVSSTLLRQIATFGGHLHKFLPPDVHNDSPKAATPLAPVSLEMRGDIYMARKMYREAIETYKSAEPTAVLVNKTGIAYHQLLDLDNARKYYEKALKLNPEYSEAVNNLGTVYYAKKNYRRAATQYKRALRLAPKSASIHSNLGTAYFARKNYDQAMTEYEVALTLDPGVFEHHSSAGVLLQERTVEERAKFHYFQAKLYAKQGMVEQALLSLRKALEEGLKERDKIGADADFAKIRDLPEFKEILAAQQRVL